MTGAAPLVDREVIIRQLHRDRSRSRFLRVSALAFALLALHAWTSIDFSAADYFSARRRANLERFLGELRPYPLHGRSWDASIAAGWLSEVFVGRGVPAAITTLAISIAAIAIAGLLAAGLALPATRSFAAAEAYVPDPRPPSRARLVSWGVCVAATRALLIFLRSLPEYVWAFLALAVLGPNVWAAVLALAIHNAGILGKLDAEVVENLAPETMEALRTLGATRLQVAVAAIRPAIRPRLLLLFFYRWETCVREATVLGMLGIVSLGYYVQDARARQYYDVMFALIVAGGVVVMIGDLLSAAARGAVRRAN